MNENNNGSGKIVSIAKIAGFLAIALVLSVILFVLLTRGEEFSMSGGMIYDETTGYTVVAADSEVIPNIKSVEIHWIAGKVNISGADTDDVTFSEERNDANQKFEPMRFKLEDGNLVIRDISRSFTINTTHSKTLNVTVPNALIDRLSVNTAGAVTDISGIDTENLVISAASGDVIIADSSVREAVLNDVSGDIYVSDSVIGKAEFGTASGNIDFAGTLKIGSISTVSGEVILTIPSNGGVLTGTSLLKINTSSGNVYVSDSINSAGSVPLIEEADFSTVSGDFTVEGQVGTLSYNSTSGNIDFTGTLGGGKISTISGDSTLNISSDSGIYTKINTLSGTITGGLEFKEDGEEDSKAPLKINTTSGDVTITKTN